MTGRKQLGREIFSGVRFRDRSAKFCRVFKATDSSTGPRVRIRCKRPQRQKFGECWRLVGDEFSVRQFGGPVTRAPGEFISGSPNAIRARECCLTPAPYSQRSVVVCCVPSPEVKVPISSGGAQPMALSSHGMKRRAG